MLKWLLFSVLLLAPLGLPAQAQTGATVVSTCGTNPQTYNPGSTRALTVDTNGNLCAGVSASISGFTAATTGTPITATTGGATGTLPAGSVVVVTNVGTTNAAYCKLGAASSTTGQYISPGGGWFAFTVGANTQITCATSTSTTTVNLTGGAGLPTGTGGGSGGSGGGGAITMASGAVASGAYSSGALASGSIAAGAQVDLLTMRGTKAAGTAASNSLLSGGVYNSTPPTLTDGQQAATQLNSSGAALVSNQGTSEYPYGSTPSRDSDTGTTSATTSSLPIVASNYQFVCSISARATATTATFVNVTLSDGTWTENYLMGVPAATNGLAGIVEMIFTPCTPASATGTAITLTLPAVGTGGVTSTMIKGYYKTTTP